MMHVTASKRFPLTNTARLVLGMVAEGHATGYAIKAEIERSTRLYWGASVGGIYPELRRLESAGLLSSRENSRGEAPRHAYEITAEGRETLHAWLTDTSEPLLEMRHEALLRVRFAGVLDGEQQREVVRRMRSVHEERIDELQGRLAIDEFDDPLHRLTIEFGIGWNTWARDWCEEVEQSLDAGDAPGASPEPVG